MISPEIIRRYPIFAGFSHEQIVILADSGAIQSVEEGYRFFEEGDKLDTVYLVQEGEVAIVMALPDASASQPVAGQLTGEIVTRDAVMSTDGPGTMFGWSGFVPPFDASAGAVAMSPSTVIVFDAARLRQAFEEDCAFGFAMMEKLVQIAKNRLMDIHMETLAFISD
ncbi:MAG: Crp/Fnr family transcriptional regulator [Chloroflexota bacterium]|nr:Crp/Fnr family transcriptional regulator [Chloroflexota bacterium]